MGASDLPAAMPTALRAALWGPLFSCGWESWWLTWREDSTRSVEFGILFCSYEKGASPKPVFPEIVLLRNTILGALRLAIPLRNFAYPLL